MTGEKREIQAIVPTLAPQPVAQRLEPIAPQPPAQVAVAEPAVTLEKPRSSWMPLTGYIVGGAGLVAIGAGVFFGVDVQNKNEELADLCTSGEDSNTCESREELKHYQSTRSSAERSQTLQAVFLVTGGVMLAAGVTLIALAPRAEQAPSVALELSPTKAGLVVSGRLF